MSVIQKALLTVLFTTHVDVSPAENISLIIDSK